MFVFQYEIKFTKRLLNLKAKTKTERKTEMETDSDRDLWNLMDLLDLVDHLRTLWCLGSLAVKLIFTKSIVGTNTVNKLLIIGLPIVTSTTIAFNLSIFDLHIRILVNV